jgi:hypothetical protein
MVDVHGDAVECARRDTRIDDFRCRLRWLRYLGRGTDRPQRERAADGCDIRDAAHADLEEALRGGKGDAEADEQASGDA